MRRGEGGGREEVSKIHRYSYTDGVSDTREASSVSHATTRRPKLHIHARIYATPVPFISEITWRYRETACRRKSLTGVGPDSYTAATALTALIGKGCHRPIISADHNRNGQSTRTNSRSNFELKLLINLLLGFLTPSIAYKIAKKRGIWFFTILIPYSSIHSLSISFINCTAFVMCIISSFLWKAN